MAVIAEPLRPDQKRSGGVQAWARTIQSVVSVCLSVHLSFCIFSPALPFLPFLLSVKDEGSGLATRWPSETQSGSRWNPHDIQLRGLRIQPVLV